MLRPDWSPAAGAQCWRGRNSSLRSRRARADHSPALSTARASGDFSRPIIAGVIECLALKEPKKDSNAADSSAKNGPNPGTPADRAAMQRHKSLRSQGVPPVNKGYWSFSPIRLAVEFRPTGNTRTSWPDLFRPSTSFIVAGREDVDARDKRGHDGSPRRARKHSQVATSESVARLVGTRLSALRLPLCLFGGQRVCGCLTKLGRRGRRENGFVCSPRPACGERSTERHEGGEGASPRFCALRVARRRCRQCR